jgi:MYXO-CTERM domain-containing protein
VSATIGATATAGLSLVALALLGMRRPARRRPARAAH